MCNFKLYAPSYFLSSGGGLLVEGCPYNSAYPWQPYNSNPNLGRRKRQTDPCSEFASLFSRTYPEQKSLSYDVVYNICKTDSKFLKDEATLLKQTLVDIQQAKAYYDRYFPVK